MMNLNPGAMCHSMLRHVELATIMVTRHIIEHMLHNRLETIGCKIANNLIMNPGVFASMNQQEE